MRVIFFGTPECAVPYLEAIQGAGGELVGVITQPDKPRGRSKELCPPPVKEAAAALQVCLLQPLNCRDAAFLQQLADLEPDILLVVAFGRILCPTLLTIPKVAALNVHYSLLPAFRGAAPVQHALLAGLAETGVTLQHVAEELDAGDIVAQATLLINDEDTTATLTQRLTKLGCDLVTQHLPAIMTGTAPRRPQDHAQVTLAPRLTKEDGVLDWSRSAQELFNQIRAVTPWPGAQTCLRGQKLLIRQARIVSGELEGEPGTIVEVTKDRGPVVAAIDGALELQMVQPQGKRAMTGAEYARGARLALGESLVSPS